MKVTVLGAGAWGTALALLVQRNGHETQLWTWQEDHAKAVAAARENREFLSGVPLPTELSVSSDLRLVTSRTEIIVVVVPSHAVRDTLLAARPHVRDDVRFVCATKGIEEGSLYLMSEVIESAMNWAKGSGGKRIGVLSGPSFAREVAAGVPTNVVAASEDPTWTATIQQTFATPWLRVYSSEDPVGVEIGGALKNVIAIAAGACDGLGLGDNTRAALITRGIAEMARLVTAKGGQVLTTAGLAGMGDLVLTCTGQQSRNRALGQKLGQGISLAEALATSAGVAEGYRTTKSAHDLALSLGVDLPICAAVHSVLYEGKAPREALQALLSRPLRAEWE